MGGRAVLVLIVLGGAAVAADYLLNRPIGLAEVLDALLTGWVTSAIRFVREKQISFSGLITVVVCLIGLLTGLHLFLRWLTRAMLPDGVDAAFVRPWPLRCTAASLGLVLLLFLAGIAAIGVTHQLSWLVSSGLAGGFSQ